MMDGILTYFSRITQKGWKVEGLHMETFEMVQESTSKVLLTHSETTSDKKSRTEHSGPLEI